MIVDTMESKKGLKSKQVGRLWGSLGIYIFYMIKKRGIEIN